MIGPRRTEESGSVMEESIRLRGQRRDLKQWGLKRVAVG